MACKSLPAAVAALLLVAPAAALAQDSVSTLPRPPFEPVPGAAPTSAVEPAETVPNTLSEEELNDPPPGASETGSKFGEDAVQDMSFPEDFADDDDAMVEGSDLDITNERLQDIVNENSDFSAGDEPGTPPLTGDESADDAGGSGFGTAFDDQEPEPSPPPIEDGSDNLPPLPDALTGEQLREVLTGNTIVGRTYQGIVFSQYFASDGRMVYRPHPGEAELGGWHITPDGKLCTRWDSITTVCAEARVVTGVLHWSLPEKPRKVLSRTVIRGGNAVFTVIDDDPAFRKPNYLLQAGAITAESINRWLEIK